MFSPQTRRTDNWPPQFTLQQTTASHTPLRVLLTRGRNDGAWPLWNTTWLISHRALIPMCNKRIRDASRFALEVLAVGPTGSTMWLHCQKATSKSSDIQMRWFDPELIRSCSSPGVNRLYGLQCNLHINSASAALINSDRCCSVGISMCLVWWNIQCF